MENLKIITMQDILDLKPCTDPLKYASMDWKGTALDILKNDKVLPEHRMWVVLKSDFISLRSRRMFAVRISRKLLEHVNNLVKLDPILYKVLECSEEHAKGTASLEDVRSAHTSSLPAYYLDDRSLSYKSSLLYYVLQSHIYNNNFLAYNVSISCRTYVSLKDQVDCLIQVLGENI